MIKVLAIGNSFSEDATALLRLLTPEIFVRNLYIGGCSLQMHCENAAENLSAYDYQENGAPLKNEKISIKDALIGEKWDFVTVQQVSSLSGITESYYPYVTELINYVKRYSSAEIILHRTWTYEKGSDHPEFFRYEFSPETMWQKIKSATDTVAAKENLRVIDVGGVIKDLRELPEFDKARGGLNLSRDGYHLSMNYGRFVAAAVWAKFFTGKYPEVPGGSPAFDAIKKYFERKEK